MSLQTNVFENGRWVTRSLDPFHFRAQNAHQEAEKKATLADSPEEAPSLGLLTRTLSMSSVVKWVIPARIRHETKNDVLFISADCVNIKEASGNYTLRNVFVKDDFDSPIQAAKILGDTRARDQGDKFNDVERHSETFESIPGPITGNIYGEWPMTLDEGQLANNSRNKSGNLPPHILVLALESDKLAFICAVNGASNEPQLLSSQHPLPVASSPNMRLGRHIAVDPKYVVQILLDLTDR